MSLAAQKPASKKPAKKPAAKRTTAARTLVVEQYGSVNGTPWKQRLVVRALGLRRRGACVSLPDHPSVRGMIRKVPHLVRIVEPK